MLAWIAMIVIAATLVVSSSRFPKFSFSMAGLLLLVALIYLVQDKIREHPITSGGDISAELGNLSFTPGYGGSYNMNGRITNHSKEQTLGVLTIRVTLLDCEGEQSDDDCITVGEATARVFTRVPPQQARDFTHNLHPGRVRPGGELRWVAKIIETTGG